MADRSRSLNESVLSRSPSAALSLSCDRVSSFCMLIYDNFGMVERGVYRSSVLQPLGHLKIKTILLLSPDEPESLFETTAKVIHLHRQLTTSWRPVSEEMIKEGLELILNIETHPILIMCQTGAHETGALVGCLRRIQKWSFNSIIFEYRSFAGSKSKYSIEQFIELFDTDLVNHSSDQIFD
jgi:protein tyrosine/serine phosphatase